MCGILGIFRTGHASAKIETDLLQRMRDTMSHRGPDDAGCFVSPDQKIGLAHRRLSIIDLSTAAAQPMPNEDASVWIVFNGEIYNHAEIRPELERRGHVFKTNHSDTEVILKGYLEWGEDVLSHLRGMFAFAIWDKKRGSLWLARDRMGVKPLYYALVSGMFIFASEIKALLEYPDLKRSLDEQAFYNHLTFVVSPPPHTLFKGIFKLPASHTMTVHEDGHTNTKRYWNPFLGIKSFSNFSEEEWIEKIISKLRESIRYRMVSDVKFGVFLSGGIDSSTNVALMAEQMNRPVETFTIGFEGPEEFNEMRYARKIVERYETNHHEIIMNLDDFVRFLPKLVYHQDEPIADAVSVPIYFLSKLARDHGTTVCQVGEGADELFCGYPHWARILNMEKWVKRYRATPSVIRQILMSLASRCPYLPWRMMGRLDVLRRASTGEPIFWGGAEAYQETTKHRFLSKTFLRRLNGYSSFEPIKRLRSDFESDAPDGTDELHWMAYLDLRLRLPEILLMRVDKMTMAAGLEGRLPFLDQEFVQLAMSIPQKIKFKDSTLKYLLKHAVEPLLPRENIYRPKQGFAVPVESWFQEKLGDWSDRKIMEFSKRTDYFNPAVIRNFISNSGGQRKWFLLNFVLWHEIWIERTEVQLPL